MRRAGAACVLSLLALLGCVAASVRPQTVIRPAATVWRDGREDMWRAVEALGRIAGDEGESEGVRDMARKRRGMMVGWMEQEAALEAILNMLGYGPCRVCVRERGVYVAAGVEEKDVLRVLEIVCRETGQGPEKVKIWPAGRESAKGTAKTKR